MLALCVHYACIVRALCVHYTCIMRALCVHYACIMRAPFGALCVVFRGIMRLGFWSEARIFHEESAFQGKHYACIMRALCVPPLEHDACIMRAPVGALCVVSHGIMRLGFWSETRMFTRIPYFRGSVIRSGTSTRTLTDQEYCLYTSLRHIIYVIIIIIIIVIIIVIIIIIVVIIIIIIIIIITIIIQSLTCNAYSVLHVVTYGSKATLQYCYPYTDDS